jgi:hypothetical protein
MKQMCLSGKGLSLTGGFDDSGSNFQEGRRKKCKGAFGGKMNPRKAPKINNY